jgi:hypothetical protein
MRIAVLLLGMLLTIVVSSRPAEACDICVIEQMKLGVPFLTLWIKEGLVWLGIFLVFRTSTGTLERESCRKAIYWITGLMVCRIVFPLIPLFLFCLFIYWIIFYAKTLIHLGGKQESAQGKFLVALNHCLLIALVVSALYSCHMSRTGGIRYKLAVAGRGSSGQYLRSMVLRNNLLEDKDFVALLESNNPNAHHNAVELMKSTKKSTYVPCLIADLAKSTRPDTMPVLFECYSKAILIAQVMTFQDCTTSAIRCQETMEALADITGRKFGEDSQKWIEWYRSGAPGDASSKG